MTIPPWPAPAFGEELNDEEFAARVTSLLGELQSHIYAAEHRNITIDISIHEGSERGADGRLRKRQTLDVEISKRLGKL